jgi:hypothetical protein
MRLILLFILTLVAVLCNAQQLEADFPQYFEVSIENRLSAVRRNVSINITPLQILSKHPSFNWRAFVVMHRGVEVASQYNAGDAGIVIVIDSLNANEKTKLTVRFNSDKTVTIARNYPKRTHADMPSFRIKQEGSL